MMTIRRAEAGDTPAVAAVFQAARAGMPYLPRLHSAAEDARFVAGQLAELESWVAVVDGAVAAWLALAPERIEQLYVAPRAQGRGIGARLVAVAQERHARLDLWTFRANARARRFYARLGFAEVEATDGLGNEERLPDVRLEWRLNARPSRRSEGSR